MQNKTGRNKTFHLQAIIYHATLIMFQSKFYKKQYNLKISILMI